MKRSSLWWVMVGMLGLMTLWYFAGQLDKEQKIKDKKPITRVEMPVATSTTHTTILGGPQAECDVWNNGKPVKAELLPNGEVLCTPVGPQ